MQACLYEIRLKIPFGTQYDIKFIYMYFYVGVPIMMPTIKIGHASEKLRYCIYTDTLYDNKAK